MIIKQSLTHLRVVKLATVACLTLSIASTALSQTVRGNPIHDFTLQDLSGNSVNPGQYRGQILLLFLLGHN